MSYVFSQRRKIAEEAEAYLSNSTVRADLRDPTNIVTALEALGYLKEPGDHTLTCVYCGMAYPEGTPPHGAQVLTDHIKTCEKHPMRRAEATITKLTAALVGLVGASDKAELEKMEVVLRMAPAPMSDKAAAIDAIHVLIELAEE